MRDPTKDVDNIELDKGGEDVVLNKRQGENTIKRCLKIFYDKILVLKVTLW